MPWIHLKNKKIKEYILDETAIKAGSELIWLWIVIESLNNEILSFYISKKRNMFVAERILSEVINKYGLHSISSDDSAWYPQACKFLKLKHHLHSSFEKNIIERTMNYIIYRTESFDDYFPCIRNKYKLKPVKQWLKLFVYQHDKEIIS
ncbi:MAG TPA: DDE-type integrase/transposase/recombinase [Candidatus Nitrosocosmicus sp.]